MTSQPPRRLSDEKPLQSATSSDAKQGSPTDPLSSITRLLSARAPSGPSPPSPSPSRRPQRALSTSANPPAADEVMSIGPLEVSPPPEPSTPSPNSQGIPRRRSSFARIRGLDKIDHKDDALSDGEPDEETKLRDILKLRLTASHTDPKTGRRRSLSAPSTPRTDEEAAAHPPPPLATLEPEEKPQSSTSRTSSGGSIPRTRPLSATDMFRRREGAAGERPMGGGGLAGMSPSDAAHGSAPTARKAPAFGVSNGDRYSLSMEAADGLIKVGFRTGQPPAHLICQKRANSFRGHSPRSPEGGFVPQSSPSTRASFSGPSPLPTTDAFALPDPASLRNQRTLSLDSATANQTPPPSSSDTPPPDFPLTAASSLPSNAL